MRPLEKNQEETEVRIKLRKSLQGFLTEAEVFVKSFPSNQYRHKTVQSFFEFEENADKLYAAAQKMGSYNKELAEIIAQSSAGEVWLANIGCVKKETAAPIKTKYEELIKSLGDFLFDPPQGESAGSLPLSRKQKVIEANKELNNLVIPEKLATTVAFNQDLEIKYCVSYKAPIDPENPPSASSQARLASRSKAASLQANGDGLWNPAVKWQTMSDSLESLQAIEESVAITEGSDPWVFVHSVNAYNHCLDDSSVVSPGNTANNSCPTATENHSQQNRLPVCSGFSL